MRVVLISYHFPPDPAVGSLRASKVAEAFRQAGHDVHVVSSRVPEASTPLMLTPSGITVQRVRPWRHPRDWWRAIKEARPGGARFRHTMAPAAGESSVAMPLDIPAWKRHIFSLLWLPDDAQGFIPPAVTAARRAFGKLPDLVYTSAPPFSAHLAGLRLARRGVRWLAEFRDPWTGNPWKPAHVRSAWSDAIERWLERRTLARAERVVAVSQGIARAFRGKLPPNQADRVLLVRNGIEWLATGSPPSRESGPRRIVHVGSFYLGRDPRLFLEALAEVARRHRLGADRLQVDLVGNCRWFNGASVEKVVQELALGPVVNFHDWVAHDVCQGIIREADILLLLAQRQPDQVPNKLYEYLGTRAPILAFVDEEGESAGMLREIGGHTLVTSDRRDDAVRALEQVLGLTPSQSRSPPDVARLREWTTEGQMRRLIEAAGGGC